MIAMAERETAISADQGISPHHFSTLKTHDFLAIFWLHCKIPPHRQSLKLTHKVGPKVGPEMARGIHRLTAREVAKIRLFANLLMLFPSEISCMQALYNKFKHFVLLVGFDEVVVDARLKGLFAMTGGRPTSWE